MGPAHRSRFRSRAAVIVTLAALPILWTPNVVVARMVVGGFRVVILGALLFAADGWIATGYVFVWQIALTRCRATRPRGSPGLAQTLAPLAENRGFESTSLQRRVRNEPSQADALVPRPEERACLAGGLDRDHPGQGDAAGRGREGVQAGRGEVAEDYSRSVISRMPASRLMVSPREPSRGRSPTLRVRQNIRAMSSSSTTSTASLS
jgi:hypothetical protein